MVHLWNRVEPPYTYPFHQRGASYQALVPDIDSSGVKPQCGDPQHRRQRQRNFPKLMQGPLLARLNTGGALREPMWRHRVALLWPAATTIALGANPSQRYGGRQWW
jgi:hypothetical protein